MQSTPIRFTISNEISHKLMVDMFNYYSGKFSPHPFEKNGFTTAAPSGFPWGGMKIKH
jgi:hypothetical protein